MFLSMFKWKANYEMTALNKQIGSHVSDIVDGLGSFRVIYKRSIYSAVD